MPFFKGPWNSHNPYKQHFDELSQRNAARLFLVHVKFKGSEVRGRGAGQGVSSNVTKPQTFETEPTFLFLVFNPKLKGFLAYS